MTIGSFISPGREAVRPLLAACVAFAAALVAMPAAAQFARVRMTPLVIHAWMPELGPAVGTMTAVDRELTAVAGEARNGRFRAAKERLRALEARPLEGRDRFLVLMFRRNVEWLRVRLIAGPPPISGDLLLEGFGVLGLNAETTRVWQSLPPDEFQDAGIAETYWNILSWGTTELPARRRVEASGFASAAEAMKYFENYRREAANLPGAATLLPSCDRIRLDQVIDGSLAAAADEPHLAASHFQKALEGQTGAAAFAIMLRIGDAYAFPAGHPFTVGIDVSSSTDLIHQIENGHLPRFRRLLPAERRRNALDWYACAAAAATSSVESRLVRFRMLMLENTHAPTRPRQFEELAEESDDDLVGWAATAAIAFSSGRPSSLREAVASAVHQEATGVATSFAAAATVVAMTYPRMDGDIAMALLESAGRALLAAGLDWAAVWVLGHTAVKYRETRRFSAAAVAARVAVERQKHFLAAFQAAASSLSPSPLQPGALEALLAEEQGMLGRMILEWRAALAQGVVNDDGVATPGSMAAEQAWREFARDVLPTLPASVRRQLEHAIALAEHMPLVARLASLYARGERACPELLAAAEKLRPALRTISDGRQRLLEMDRFLARCNDEFVRRHYQEIAAKDILLPVRAALADSTGASALQAEVSFALQQLMVIHDMKAWTLLEHWATEARKLAATDVRLHTLDIYAFLMLAESLRGQERFDESVDLIASRLEAEPDRLNDIVDMLMSSYARTVGRECECEMPSCDPVLAASAYQVAVVAQWIVARIQSGVTQDARSSAEQASLERLLATQPALAPEELARMEALQRQRADKVEGSDNTPMPTETVDDVVQSLPPGVTLLTYVPAEEEDLLIWIFRRGVVRLEYLPGVARRVDRNARALQDELLDAVDGGWKTLAAELSRDLIEPVGPLVDGEILMIIAHDTLARLPFDILMTGDGRPLCETHPVVYLESMLAFDDASAAAPPAGKAVVIGINGDGIAAAEDEARQVATVLDTTPRLGSVDADEAIAAMRDAPIIHIAAHTRLFANNPFDSYLSLGGGRRLRAWELFRDAPAAELITLSACDTAMETRIPGGLATHQGPSSSLMAFAFSGGAQFALSSLWTASDSVTAELMTRFYTALAGGTDVVRALHEARLAIRRRSPGMHPHYLANFRLTGRNASVVSSRLRGDH